MISSLIKTRNLLIGIYFITFFNEVKGQGIKWIRIDDSISHPLKDYDDGVSFSFFNENLGQVGAIVRTNEHIYELFSKKRLVYGERKLIISPKSLRNFFFFKSSYKSGTLIISHNSIPGNRFNERSLNIRFKIDAPYGAEFYDYPSRPKLYSTNIKIRKTSGFAILGITVGIGLSVGGILLAIDNDSLGDSDGANWMIVGGIGLLSLSGLNLHYYESNQYLNNYNRRLNKNLLEQWNNNKMATDRSNTLIRNSVTIKIIL